MKNKTKKRVLFLFILAGLIVINYPYISQKIKKTEEKGIIREYQKNIDKMQPEVLENIKENAREYNIRLADNQSPLSDGFSSGDIKDREYEKQLNPFGEGLMGYIQIPKIEADLPIYHGVSTEVLERGAGHLKGSSLPVGGEGTHSVVSSHRGLPSAELFTNLDQLEKGDIFIFYILDEALAYEVDNIKTVLPDETESLRINEGEDRATLVTCTPYGINSHRLLVQGIRTELDSFDGDGMKRAGMSFWMNIIAVTSAVILIVSGKILLFPSKRRKNREKI
ncbi:MAG: class C sortase [Anaerovoracaceae bacterium]